MSVVNIWSMCHTIPGVWCDYRNNNLVMRTGILVSESRIQQRGVGISDIILYSSAGMLTFVNTAHERRRARLAE